MFGLPFSFVMAIRVIGKGGMIAFFSLVCLFESKGSEAEYQSFSPSRTWVNQSHVSFLC